MGGRDDFVGGIEAARSRCPRGVVLVKKEGGAFGVSELSPAF